MTMTMSNEYAHVDTGKVLLHPSLLRWQDAQDDEDESIPVLAYTTVERKVYEQHDSEPIRDKEDITRIVDYYLERGQYRKLMMFIIAINTGMRFVDLRTLTFGDFLDETGHFKKKFIYVAIKTAAKREQHGHQQNLEVYVNKAVREAIRLYWRTLGDQPLSLNDPIFVNEGRNGRGNALNQEGYRRHLHSLINSLGIGIRCGTHTTRKTFAYHVATSMVDAARRTRTMDNLILLQQMLGHASMKTTCKYIGIASEEIEAIYLNLNLGLDALQRYTASLKEDDKLVNEVY